MSAALGLTVQPSPFISGVAYLRLFLVLGQQSFPDLMVAFDSIEEARGTPGALSSAMRPLAQKPVVQKP